MSPSRRSRVVAVLFVPAGTWRFWQAWTFLAVVFSFPFCAFLHFHKHDPGLLERRLRSRETIREQKCLMRLVKPIDSCLAIPNIALTPPFAWSVTLGRTPSAQDRVPSRALQASPVSHAP